MVQDIKIKSLDLQQGIENIDINQEMHIMEGIGFLGLSNRNWAWGIGLAHLSDRNYSQELRLGHHHKTWENNS